MARRDGKWLASRIRSRCVHVRTPTQRRRRVVGHRTQRGQRSRATRCRSVASPELTVRYLDRRRWRRGQPLEWLRHPAHSTRRERRFRHRARLNVTSRTGRDSASDKRLATRRRRCLVPNSNRAPSAARPRRSRSGRVDVPSSNPARRPGPRVLHGTTQSRPLRVTRHVPADLRPDDHGQRRKDH